MAAQRSQGEPDGQAAKWSDRRIGGTDGGADGRTAGQRSPLALLVGSWPRWALGYTSNTFITSARVTDGKCAYSSFVARSPHPASPASPSPALSRCQPVSRLPWPYVIRKGKRTNENFPIIADTARTRPQRKFLRFKLPSPNSATLVDRRPPFAIFHAACRNAAF